MANSLIMWLACAPGVLIVLFQAILFFRRSKKDALRVGLTEKQVKSAIRSAAVTSVGPCFVMLTAMLSLMLYVGAPLAWLRVDFIGSVSYELQGGQLCCRRHGHRAGHRGNGCQLSVHRFAGDDNGLSGLGHLCGAVFRQDG